MRRPYERLLEILHEADMGLKRRRIETRSQLPQAGPAFRFEQLEPRVALAADGLVTLGAQPTGPLTGKIVYTSGGHGWQWNNNVNRYATDRGDNVEIVEDFGNQDQMSFYVDHLWRAGATVVPMRPVGRQINERVLDNDSAGVTFTGAWSNSASTRYYDEDYGVVADTVPYRFASTSATETATATYTPNIPQDGVYPVYTWVLRGTDRTLTTYRVNHTGGSTEVKVDHSRVGSGWVYLGTYHFAAGSSAAEGSVTISNKGTTGNVVIADAIRFGNGMGDSTVSGGPTVSGYPREDENSWHWIARSIGVGTTLSTAIGSGVNNVSAPSNFAEYMNAAPFGQSVYVSFHSNATTGNPSTATARGAIGLIDSDQGTPNQSSLALYLGRQINTDMQALNGTFENNWGNRTTHASSGGFGEIDLGADAEMDATIIEVGFHDTTLDAEMLRDPRVRDQIARSTYEGTLEYFDNFGGLNAPVATASAPINVRAISNASGQVTVSWNAGPVGVQGAAATGFMIYASANGYGFDGGTFVAGGGTTSATLSGYDPTLPYYFKVVAVNAGGESKASEVMAALPNGGLQKILIVSGFDRYERTQNFRYPYAFTGDSTTDRVWPRYNNSFDYSVQMATAIHASAPNASISTTSNEAVISGAVNLDNYDGVFWILGEESTATDTFNATEQTKVSDYLAQGGKLFVSGSEIGFDLDAQGGGQGFYNSILRADYQNDDAGTYSVTAAAGSIFTGLSFNFSNGAAFSNLMSQTYDVNAPDRITPLLGASTGLNYVGGSGTGAAATYYSDPATQSQVVMFAFPFETITTAANRAAVMERVIQYFQLTEEPSEIEAVLNNDDGPSVYTETGSWQTSGLTGYNGTSFRFATVGTPATAEWQFAAPFSGFAEVFVQFRASASRATNAVYRIDTGDDVATAAADQTANGLTWVSLGTYFFEQGVRTITLDAEISSGGTVVNADAVRVVLTAATAPNADFNNDQMADGHDFLAWQLGLGATGATPADGDANGDAIVDGADLAIWQSQFGTPAAPAMTLSASGSAAATASTEAALVDGNSFVPLAQHLATLAITNERPAQSVEEPRQATFEVISGTAAFFGSTPRRATVDAIEVDLLANADDSDAATDEALEGSNDWLWGPTL